MIPDLSFDLLARDLTKNAFASVDASVKGVEGRVGRLKTAFSGFGDALGGIGGAAAVLGGLGLGAFVQDSLNEWDQAASSLAKVETVLKSTGGAAGLAVDDLQSMADGLQKLTVFDGDQIMGDITTPLLTFTKIAGPEFEKAQGLILDVSTVMQTDLLSATTMVGKALNDPVKGMTALSKAGIQFTQDQKDMVRAMVETGDTAGAQNVILGELGTQFGGQAAAAAQSGLGPLKQLSNAWGDFKQAIGAGAAELLPPVTNALTGLIGAFTSLPEPIQTAVGGFAGAAAVILPIAGTLGLITTAIGGLSPLLPVLGRALTLALGPVGLITTAIVGIGIAIYQNWDEIKAATEGIVATFLDLKDRAVAAISGLVTGVTEWLTTKLSAAWDAVGGKIQAVGDKFAWLYDKVVGNSWIPDMVIEIGQWMGQLDNNMVKPATDAVGATGAAFEGLGGKVVSGLESIFSDGKLEAKEFADLGISIFKDMATQIIKDSVEPLGRALSGVFSGRSGGGGGNWFSGLFSGIGSFFGIPGLARGTTNAKRGLTVVGEDGPELMQMGGGERVYPTGDTKRMLSEGSASSINMPITINAQGADAAALARVQTSIQDLGRSIPSLVDSRTAQRQMRNTRAPTR